MGIRQTTQLAEQWRAAEARLATRDPDAADFEEIIRVVDRLRAEYQRVTGPGRLGGARQARPGASEAA